MSYRRYGGYRRSYGRRRSSSGGRVRRSLKAEIAGTVDTLVTSNLAVPVDSTRNVGINIHEMIVQRSVIDAAANWIDKDYEAVWLNRTTPTVEKHVSDIDYICGIDSIVSKNGTPANVFVMPRRQVAKCYPPIPVFQDEIKLCSYNHFADACTYYVEVVYTLAWMSVGQIMGISKNIII